MAQSTITNDTILKIENIVHEEKTRVYSGPSYSNKNFYINKAKTAHLKDFTTKSIPLKYSYLFGLEYCTFEVKEKRVDSINHSERIRTEFIIYYKNIPLHYSRNKLGKLIISEHDHQVTIINVNTNFVGYKSPLAQPKISTEQAFQLALEDVNASQYIWDLEVFKNKREYLKASYAREDKRFYLLNEHLVLTYYFKILTWGKNKNSWNILIDANTGKVLLKESSYIY